MIASERSTLNGLTKVYIAQFGPGDVSLVEIVSGKDCLGNVNSEKAGLAEDGSGECCVGEVSFSKVGCSVQDFAPRQSIVK